MERRRIHNFAEDREIAEAYRYCANVTRSSSTNFYLAFLTLPREIRASSLAAYAYCRMCDDIVDEPEPGADQKAQLEQVRKSVKDAYSGLANGPIWIALADTFQRFDLDQSHLLAVADGCEMDIDTDRYETFEDLLVYCHRVASSVGLMCIEICGFDNPDAPALATDLGVAFQLTNVMRDVREDALRGRVYLPLEDLEQFDVSHDELTGSTASPRFRRMMAFQIERARNYYESGSKVLPMLNNGRSCPDLMLNFYSRILDNIETADGDVLSKRIGLGTASKIALMTKLLLKSAIRF